MEVSRKQMTQALFRQIGDRASALNRTPAERPPILESRFEYLRGKRITTAWLAHVIFHGRDDRDGSAPDPKRRKVWTAYLTSTNPLANLISDAKALSMLESARMYLCFAPTGALSVWLGTLRDPTLPVPVAKWDSCTAEALRQGGDALREMAKSTEESECENAIDAMAALAGAGWDSSRLRALVSAAIQVARARRRLAMGT